MRKQFDHSYLGEKKKLLADEYRNNNLLFIYIRIRLTRIRMKHHSFSSTYWELQNGSGNMTKENYKTFFF